MELGDCSGLIEPDLNVCAIDLNHFAVAITKYPTVRPWMKLNALAHHIGGPWLGFGCHRRAPAGMTVNIINKSAFGGKADMTIALRNVCF
jgi:hypothetical protein